jgi:hypothetical protein
MNQSPQGITDRQVSFIREMARERGYNDASVADKINKLFGTSDLTRLDRRQASEFIEKFKTVPRKSEPVRELEPVVNQATGEIMEDDEIPF